MNKIMHRVLFFAAVAVATLSFFGSCLSGSDVMSATIRLHPYQIALDAESVKDTTVASGTVLHIFYADSTNWGVFSYEDAEAGILRDRIYREETNENGETVITDITPGTQTMSPGFTDRVEQYEADDTRALSEEDKYRYIKSGPVVQELVFAVIFDPDTGMYGWREIQIAGGLPQLRLIAYFDKTRTSDYIQSKWNMYIKPAPTDPDPENPTDPEE